eukprot:1595002-Rhodomonas_salina.2
MQYTAQCTQYKNSTHHNKRSTNKHGPKQQRSTTKESTDRPAVQSADKPEGRVRYSLGHLESRAGYWGQESAAKSNALPRVPSTVCTENTADSKQCFTESDSCCPEHAASRLKAAKQALQHTILHRTRTDATSTICEVKTCFDRQIDGQIHADRQIDRETERQRDRETER